MNFLLHRHLAARELGSSVAGVGAMLPDLWRMADRRVRPLPDIVAAPDDAADLQHLLDGIDHHLAADRWFHAAAAFADGERLMHERFREAVPDAPKLGLFAHVAWEMWLDGELVRREGLDNILAKLAHGFAVVRGTSGSAAVGRHHFDRIGRTQDERATFDAGMTRILDELSRGEWIEGYQHGVGVARRVSGMRGRLGLPRLGADDQQRLGVAIDSLKTTVAGALDRILTEAPALARRRR